LLRLRINSAAATRVDQRQDRFELACAEVGNCCAQHQATSLPCNDPLPHLVSKSELPPERAMEEFHLVHWIVVLAVIVVSIIPWGYPLSRLCRRAGKPPAIGWIAGSIGLLFLFGPIWCVWWLAFSKWSPPES
jgi:hypothetical protein